MTGEGCSDDDPPDNRAYIDLKNKIAGAVSLDELVDDALVDDVIQAIRFCHENQLSESGKLNGASKKVGGFSNVGKSYIWSDYSPQILNILERIGLIIKQETTIDSLRYRRFRRKARGIYFSLIKSGYFENNSKNDTNQ